MADFTIKVDFDDGHTFEETSVHSSWLADRVYRIVERINLHSFYRKVALITITPEQVERTGESNGSDQ